VTQAPASPGLPEPAGSRRRFIETVKRLLRRAASRVSGTRDTLQRLRTVGPDLDAALEAGDIDRALDLLDDAGVEAPLARAMGIEPNAAGRDRES
jgi:hypothetical protein